MSGGSHNYLYCKDADELFNSQDDLDFMASRLIELGYEDAGKEVLNLLYTVKQSKARIEVMQTRLEKVMQAVEWYDSADSGIESVQKAIEDYRGEAGGRD